MKPLVINLLGGPGCGKSSMASSVFAWLKWNDINCELALEYAKEVVWENAESILSNQIYVFGQQHRRVFRLLSKVDVVITDSPLLLSIIYDAKKSKALKSLVLDEFHKCNNVTYFLTRKKKYNELGRLQKEAEAKEIDVQVKDLLKGYAIPFKEIDGVPENAQTIGTDIFKILRLEKNDLISPSLPVMVSCE